MRISEAENKRIIKEIETRRIFYNQILNNEKGEEELDNEDVFKIAREQLYIEGELPKKALEMVLELNSIHKDALLKIWETQEFVALSPLE